MTASTPTSYLAPTTGAPTRASVSEALGFTVPTRFAEYVRRVYDLSDGDPERCLDVFDATLGLFPNGAGARYSGTPPELFPVGSTGCDGDHYGFLLHAPELGLDDFPFAHYCPMDSDGVVLMGSTTMQGIASVMATLLSYDFRDEEKSKLIVEVAHKCGITIKKEPYPTIPVPNGWRFLPSSDGVGTLAPIEQFGPHPMVALQEYGPPEAFIEAAHEASRGGYFGTALHYLREGLWSCWMTKPYDLAGRMVEVYRRMNRDELAEVLSHTMRQWREVAGA